MGHIPFSTCFAADGNIPALKGGSPKKKKQTKPKQMFLHGNYLPNIPLTGWALSVCFAS